MDDFFDIVGDKPAEEDEDDVWREADNKANFEN